MKLICECGHQRGDHQGMGPSRGKPVLSACGACSCQQWKPLQTPQQLGAIVDVVLNYRPKSKQPKPRKRKKAKKVKHA